MNRKIALILLAIVNGLIYIPLCLLLALGKMKVVLAIIAFIAVSIITMAVAFLIIRKYPPVE